MKKLLTIVTVAVVSLNFVSCRQEDDSTELSSTNIQEKVNFGKVTNTVKIDTVKSNSLVIPVDPDPPVKDGTRW